MSIDPWDQRFAGDAYVYGVAPNAHLVANAHRLPPAAAILLPGDGEGRNGAWLAGLGHDVLSVDRSSVGLDKARRLAGRHGATLRTECADLAEWTWPVAAFDAVVSIFLHLPPPLRRQVHRNMAAALRPGGLLILEAFRPEQLALGSGGPKDPDMLYRAADLGDDFAALDALELAEAETVLDEGPLHQGHAAVVRLVARKPNG